MANQEACELYIEQQIQEGLDDGQTPYYIGKHLSEWIEKLFETKINPKTLESRAYRQKNTSNEVKHNQPKTHTKPETKIQISKIADEIKGGAVSDDHAKVIGDAIADAITNGTCSKRVGTKVHTAVKKVNKDRKEVKIKEIDNYQMKKEQKDNVELCRQMSVSTTNRKHTRNRRQKFRFLK
jgi:hypothetical protein